MFLTSPQESDIQMCFWNPKRRAISKLGFSTPEENDIKRGVISKLGFSIFRGECYQNVLYYLKRGVISKLGFSIFKGAQYQIVFLASQEKSDIKIIVSSPHLLLGGWKISKNA